MTKLTLQDLPQHLENIIRWMTEDTARAKALLDEWNRRHDYSDAIAQCVAKYPADTDEARNLITVMCAAGHSAQSIAHLFVVPTTKIKKILENHAFITYWMALKEWMKARIREGRSREWIKDQVNLATKQAFDDLMHEILEETIGEFPEQLGEDKVLDIYTQSANLQEYMERVQKLISLMATDFNQAEKMMELWVSMKEDVDKFCEEYQNYPQKGDEYFDMVVIERIVGRPLAEIALRHGLSTTALRKVFEQRPAYKAFVAHQNEEKCPPRDEQVKTSTGVLTLHKGTTSLEWLAKGDVIVCDKPRGRTVYMVIEKRQRISLLMLTAPQGSLMILDNANRLENFLTSDGATYIRYPVAYLNFRPVAFSEDEILEEAARILNIDVDTLKLMKPDGFVEPKTPKPMRDNGAPGAHIVRPEEVFSIVSDIIMAMLGNPQQVEGFLCQWNENKEALEVVVQDILKYHPVPEGREKFLSDVLVIRLADGDSLAELALEYGLSTTKLRTLLENHAAYHAWLNHIEKEKSQ